MTARPVDEDGAEAPTEGIVMKVIRGKGFY
jgi:hypothetical protein